MIVALLGRGQQLHDVVQQHQGAHISHGAAAQHGEHAQLTDALTEALSHLGVGEVLAVEEALHEFLAGLRHGFLQRIVELVDDATLSSGSSISTRFRPASHRRAYSGCP